MFCFSEDSFGVEEEAGIAFGFFNFGIIFEYIFIAKAFREEV